MTRRSPTPNKRPDVEGMEARVKAGSVGFLAHAREDITALIAYIKALEARQVKLEAEIRRRWVNSLVKQGAAFDSATRNVASRPVLDSDGEGDG